MKRLLLLILSIFTFSCSHSDYKPSAKECLCNEISKKVAIQLKKDKELYPCGSGGRTMNGVKMLALSFDYYKPINIEEGRKILVYATNTFANEVNAEKRIHPYLVNYPFKPDNIEIAIFLRNPDGSTVSQGNLRVISISEGELRYRIGDPETHLLNTIYRETYEEALQKLGEMTSVPTTKIGNESDTFQEKATFHPNDHITNNGEHK